MIYEIMKRVLKYIAVVFLAGGLFNACETTDLDQRVSPNDLASNQADPNLLLNSIQLAYASNMTVISDRGAELTRIDYMFGRDYFNNYPGSTFDGIWSRTYSSGFTQIGPTTTVQVGMFTNINNLISINEATEVDYSFHIAVGKTLQAHMLMLLVDYLGEAAFSEASNPEEFSAPLLDDGPSVYNEALGLLSEAEALFNTDPATLGATDLFYGGDSDLWLKLVNTIRLKAYVTTGDAANFNSVIAGGNYITEAEDDFEFQFGASELQPDTRHPDYAADYTTSGANIYQSNWLMETMLDDNDPRIRYYFYRQVGETPGADADPDEETLACSLVVPPQHFQDGGFTYCSVELGYWGRTHGNDEGTPPDNFTRVAVGVYPAGGKFDGDLFRNGSIEDQGDGTFDFELDAADDGVNLGLGAGGVGIEPIILSSYVEFWRAQMAMAAGDAPAASGFIRSGLEKSIAKVQSFQDPNFIGGALLDDSTFDSATGAITSASLASSLVPTAADVTAYIDGKIAEFDGGDNETQMNVLGEEYFKTLFGGATEAYNFYRSTGFPNTLVPNWELNPGAFPRTFLYPQNEVITNPNLTQRSDLATQVFWDTNPASPTFPSAN